MVFVKENWVPLIHSHIKEPLKIRLEAFLTMSNTRIYQDSRFKFLGACSAFAFALFMIAPNGPPAEANTQNTIIAEVPKIDLTRDDLYLVSHPTAKSAQTLTLKSGDSLGPLLQKNGLEPRPHRVIAYNKRAHQPHEYRRLHHWHPSTQHEP